MGQRYQDANDMKKNFPGPGTYGDGIRNSIPTGKFGTSTRQSFDGGK